MSTANIREEVLFFSTTSDLPIDESQILSDVIQKAKHNLHVIMDYDVITDEEAWFLLDHIRNHFEGLWFELGLKIISRAPGYPFTDEIATLRSVGNPALTHIRSQLLAKHELEIEVCHSHNLQRGIISLDTKGFLTEVANPQSLTDGEVELLLLVYRELTSRDTYKQHQMINTADMIEINVRLKQVIESNGYAAYNVFNLAHSQDHLFTQIFDKLHISYSYVGARVYPSRSASPSRPSKSIIGKIVHTLRSAIPAHNS